MDSMPRHLLEKWAEGSRPNNKNRGSDILMVYFTSDMHFGHRAIIAMLNRPFESLASNVCGYTPINLGKIIKDGVLSDIESIHRITIDKAIEKKTKKEKR